MNQALSTGYFNGPHHWLDLHSQAEPERDCMPGELVRRVVRQSDGKAKRQLVAGRLDPESGKLYHRILALEPFGGAPNSNAALLRIDGLSEPICLGDPDDAFTVCSSTARPNATLMVARTNTAATLQWTVDTRIDRLTTR